MLSSSTPECAWWRWSTACCWSPYYVYPHPPALTLALQGGVLRLSKPREHHGARLPFDFFLLVWQISAAHMRFCAILWERVPMAAQD